MAKASWNGVVIAESDKTVVVDGNHYFPPGSVTSGYLAETSHASVCPWKGQAGYFTVTVDGKENPNAAWIYREPKPAAVEIKDHIAFWRGVRVEG